MLIGIDPLLGPDCLAVLRAMGHGDHLVLADANFPAASNARRLLRMDGASMLQALGAVLSVLPIDDFEPDPLLSMQVVGDANAVPPIVRDMQGLVDRVVPAKPRIVARERFAFYELARSAYAVIATSERAFYANLILRKGVVPPRPGDS
ncbi:MAG TPA: RbsD/FucU domain-containing protein [Polyangiaceae bacterium]|nr:RbsD/FucU domain-containing protein [Polyangiaceae bacterium]